MTFESDLLKAGKKVGTLEGTLTIVGGTGAWVGAAGTDTIVNRPDGTAVHTISIKL